MARLIRIDSELVRRGLARSRTHAATLITDGHVTLDPLCFISIISLISIRHLTLKTEKTQHLIEPHQSAIFEQLPPIGQNLMQKIGRAHV